MRNKKISKDFFMNQNFSDSISYILFDKFKNPLYEHKKNACFSRLQYNNELKHEKLDSIGVYINFNHFDKNIKKTYLDELVKCFKHTTYDDDFVYINKKDIPNNTYCNWLTLLTFTRPLADTSIGKSFNDVFNEYKFKKLDKRSNFRNLLKNLNEIHIEAIKKGKSSFSVISSGHWLCSKEIKITSKTDFNNALKKNKNFYINNYFAKN